MKHTLSVLLGLALAALFCAVGCVKVDTKLGGGFNQKEQLFTIYRAEVDLSDIIMKQTDSLSGYSTRRVTVGSIRDPFFGLTCKSSAFTLTPVSDTLNFGSNTRFKGFHVSMAKDTLSCSDNTQSDILQTFHVYALEDAGIALDSTILYTSDIKKSQFNGLKDVTTGTLVYDGGDSLSFNISKEYGTKLMKRFIDNGTDGKLVIDSIPCFTKLFPGLFITCDEPMGEGGRINMFLTKLSYNSNLYIVADYAELKFTADYGTRKDVDTSFVFIIGGTDFMTSSATSVPDQYVFNAAEHTGASLPEDRQYLYVEGGSGYKPVISSKEIREAMIKEMAMNGITDPSHVIINKASLSLPFDLPSDYVELDKYPEKLCPTCRLRGTLSDSTTKYITYANLTDASISAEDQGEINRSTLRYTPDISFHAQKILSLKDPTEEDYDNFNLWFMITCEEEEKVENDTGSSTSDYYSQLAYYSYLNSMYGGYGGYGYGGYSSYGAGFNNYGYDNYYSMLSYYNMMSAYSSSSSTSYTEELDRDRYYKAVLHGPANVGEKPKLIFTYSVAKTFQEEEN